MRLQDISINPDTMRLEIDIMEKYGSLVIVICDGKAKLTELPEYGETRIITHQGKVKRVKYNEGEEL